MKKLSLLFALFVLVSLSACTGSDTPVTGGSGADGDIEVSGGEYGYDRHTVYADELYAQELADRIRDRVFFAFDSYALDASAIETLKAQIAWLKANPEKKITLEGHADERGTREYNLGLGDRRANAVRRYMVAQGISPSRIRTVSYGKERPAILGANEAAWAQNRRTVTVTRE